MLGVVHRYDGGEEQIPGGVTISEAEHGIAFEASALSLGTGEVDTAFLLEADFTPNEAPAEFTTLLAAGGNLFVRVESGQLVYGWSSSDGNEWTDHKESVPLPTADEEHSVSIAFVPGSTNQLHLWIDGTAGPVVYGDGAPVIADGLQNSFGFANDVHAAARDRGFISDLTHIRAAQFDGEFSPELFELQPALTTSTLLHIDGFGGSVEAESYVPGDRDTVRGALSVADASTSEEGLLLEASGFAAFTPDAEEERQDAPLVIEASVSGAQDGRLFSAGDFVADVRDSALVFGAGETSGTIDIEGEATVVSIALARGETGDVTAYPAVDGVEHDPLVLGDIATGDEAGTVVYGSHNGEDSAAAELRAVRVADLLTDEVTRSVFQLQPREPEVCTPLVDIEPGNQIEISSDECSENILELSTMVRPTEAQQSWQETQLTAFIHFGINTFYDQEWGHGDEDPERFQPTEEVDAEGWVRELRDAGYRYAILVVKHHDGFLSYPSRYTDYSVASTPWQDGQGDILRDFTDAARAYGMNVGVYMSPADSNQEKFGVYGNGSAQEPRTIPTLVEGDDRAGEDLPTFTYEATDYGEYFLNQLYEVLTEYGQIDEVWFDGAEGNTEKHEPYDYTAFYEMIYELQPNAVVAVGGPDVRWVGNEHGEARPNEWSNVAIVEEEPGGKIGQTSSNWEDYGSRDQLIQAVQSGEATHLKWWPSEADMKLTPGWFAHDSDVPKTPEELMQHYRETTGRNSVMLLNVPPTTTGHFADESTEAIHGFAELRRMQYTNDVALGQPVTISGDETEEVTDALTDGNTRTGWSIDAAEPRTATVEFGSEQPITSVWHGEDTFSHGQSIERAIVEARVDGEWIEIGEVGAVGLSQAVTPDSAVSADAIRVQVLEARGAYSLGTLQAFTTLDADPGLLTEVYLDCSAEAAGPGTADRPFSSLEQFRQAEIDSGAHVYLVPGSDCLDSTTPFWGYGTDDAPITVSLSGEGAVPSFGDRSAEDVFGPLTEQGWVLDLPDADNGDGDGDGDSDGPGDSDGDDSGTGDDTGQRDDADTELPSTGAVLPWGLLLALAVAIGGLGLLLRVRRRALNT